MQDVNDDMDELFRRAANNYPLNTNGADWSKIAAALNRFVDKEVEEDTAGDPVNSANRYLDILLLFMLLAIPLICVDYISQNHFISHAARAINVDTIHTSSSDNYENNLKLTGKPSVLSFYKRIRNNNLVSKSINIKLVRNANPKTYDKALPGTASDKAMSKGVVSITPASPNQNENRTLNKRNSAETTPNDSINAKANNVAANTPPIKGDNTSKNNGDTGVRSTTSSNEKEIMIKRKKNALYVGILAGPDISTVKFQSINKAGFSAGLTIDYTLGKKLTLGTGLLWDKKFYYTEGKYFNPKNLSIPSFISIDDVDGICNMIEWPVNLSYKIQSFHKSSLSGNAGISSYFMKRENYSYTYQRNGVENEWMLSYKNSSHNLFSVINAGVSYERNLSKTVLLKIQPYVKIPISGVGMGRLPIASSGVYFVVAKKIL